MTLAADLTPAAHPLADDRVVRPGAVGRARPGRAGVVTAADVLRLAATLTAVGAVVSVMGLSASGNPDLSGQRVLETAYGVVALGHVTVDAVAPMPGAGAETRVTVPVTLHNLSGAPVHYGPQHFRLHAGGDSARPEAGSVRTGEVAAGGAVQLDLVFDVRSATSVRLTVDEAEPATGLRLQLPPATAAVATS